MIAKKFETREYTSYLMEKTLIYGTCFNNVNLICPCLMELEPFRGDRSNNTSGKHNSRCETYTQIVKINNNSNKNDNSNMNLKFRNLSGYVSCIINALDMSRDMWSFGSDLRRTGTCSTTSHCGQSCLFLDILKY